MRRRQLISLVSFVAITLILFGATLLARNTPLLGLDLQGGVSVVLAPSQPTDSDTIDQTIEIIRNRVDALGVAEPEITRQGDNILVQLPGIEDQERVPDGVDDVFGVGEGIADGPLPLPQLADVPEDHDDADEAPGLVADRGGTVVDEPIAPVLGDEYR